MGFGERKLIIFSKAKTLYGILRDAKGKNEMATLSP